MANNAFVYTVLQVNTYIKRMFDGDFFLSNLQVKGELSNVKYHSSGHIYFSLKDDKSSISAVMFKNDQMKGLDFTLENGQTVIIRGDISVYERDGRYQMYARQISLEGLGDLYEAYEKLKQKLYEEGLFDFEVKKPIPSYPKKVGVVTADTGAAIQDIKNIAKRRNPFVQLYLYPAKVQGDGAAKTIVEGIKTLDKMGMDTIIIGRGGGSIEDLWAFNEESVARAIYHAKTPIISGTGHEIDNTIADYVADLRAPTPSAACELAIPDVMSLLDGICQSEKYMNQCMENRLNRYQQRFHMLQTRLNNASPKKSLENKTIYLDNLSNQLLQAMKNRYTLYKNRYDVLLARLDGVSPTAKLINGYGYIETEDGKPLSSIRTADKGCNIRITVSDGTLEATVNQVTENKKR